MERRQLARALISLEAVVVLLFGGLPLAFAFIPAPFVEGTRTALSYGVPGLAIVYGMALAYLAIKWDFPSASSRILAGVLQVPLPIGAVLLSQNGTIQGPPSILDALPFLVPAAVAFIAIRPGEAVDGQTVGQQGGRAPAQPIHAGPTDTPTALFAAAAAGGGAIALGCLLIIGLFAALIVAVLWALATQCHGGGGC